MHVDATQVSDQGISERSSTTGLSDAPRVPLVTALRLYGGLYADSVEVEACERNHDSHKWTTFIVEPPDEPPFAVSICGRCCVRRCTEMVKDPDPASVCTLPVGHLRRPHRDINGYWRTVR